MHSPHGELPAAALSALNEGKLIEAIKIVRETRGTGLKEAKDEVEAYLKSDAALQARFRSARIDVKRSALFWLILVVIAAVMLFIYFRGP